MIRQLLASKFGKEYAQEAASDVMCRKWHVNENLIRYSPDRPWRMWGEYVHDSVDFQLMSAESPVSSDPAETCIQQQRGSAQAIVTHNLSNLQARLPFIPDHP